MGDILSERSQCVSQEVVLRPSGIFDKITFEMGDQSQEVVNKGYHIKYGFFNT